MAVNLSPRPDRESELADALAALRSRLAAAAEAAGRKVDEIELLPITKFFPATDVAILSRLGCSAFGESREQEAAVKVVEVARLLGPASTPVRWHMVGQIQRNKARSLANWADTAHSVSSTRVARALDRAVAAARSDGRREEPLRVYVQISLDGDVSRGGVDVSDPGGRRRNLRAGRGLAIPGTGRADGDPPTGLGSGSGIRAAAIRAPANTSSAPESDPIVGRNVRRPRKCR